MNQFIHVILDKEKTLKENQNFQSLENALFNGCHPWKQDNRNIILFNIIWDTFVKPK